MADPNPLATLDSIVKGLGAFLPAPIDRGRFEAFVGLGGRDWQRWMAITPEGVATVSCTDHVANGLSASVEFPLTRPLTPEVAAQVAPTIMSYAYRHRAGLLGLCNDNRVTLVFEQAFPAADVAALAAWLRVYVPHGATVAKGLMTLLAERLQLATDVGSDRLLVFSAGRPVKLTAAEMQMVSGGLVA